MKFNQLALTLAICLASTLTGLAQQKIAVVDLQKVFDGYYKTQEADKMLKDQGKEFERTLKEMLANHKSKLTEVERSRKDAANPALAQSERDRLSQEADSKLAQLRTMEGNIQTFDQTSKRTLAERQLEFRENIIKELGTVISGIAKARGYDLVLDSVARSKNDTPIVLYSSGRDDITEETIRIANQTRGAGATTTPGTTNSGLGFTPGR